MSVFSSNTFLYIVLIISTIKLGFQLQKKMLNIICVILWTLKVAEKGGGIALIFLDFFTKSGIFLYYEQPENLDNRISGFR